MPFSRHVRQKKEGGRTVTMTKSEYKALEYYVMREKVGMGLLEPVIKDQNIEDITCDGYGPIFLEHKIFKGLKTTVEFSQVDLNRFVLQMSEKIGKPITFASPIVDATLPDGSRINIVYGDDVSKRGSNFTIRKFSDKPLSILTLIESNTLDFTMAAYLWIMLQEGMSAFVSGETASGKTTTLNAIMAFISPTRQDRVHRRYGRSAGAAQELDQGDHPWRRQGHEPVRGRHVRPAARPPCVRGPTTSSSVKSEASKAPSPSRPSRQATRCCRRSTQHRSRSSSSVSPATRSTSRRPTWTT